MRIKEEFDKVKQLLDQGCNKCEVSRQTNIPRGTINSWIKDGFCPKAYDSAGLKMGRYSDVNINEYFSTVELQRAYSHALAVYLSDGYIVRMPHKKDVYKITFYNDIKYPKNTKEWADNLQLILSKNRVSTSRPRGTNVNIVTAYSKSLPVLFPQFGSGEKYTRKLELSTWQKDIIKNHPSDFIRGCIQSDGCIYQQKIKGVYYKKYNFVNKSSDIIDFFLFALNAVGIKKEKYLHPTKQLYVIQNFSPTDSIILESIIGKKE
jgi:hypothetical protein